ncbi:MAG: DUF1573 domain-containing protein [Bacteroidales bacterium]|nr:DUF1573 domain-containing protein [Bacteroidales bacterium]
MKKFFSILIFAIMTTSVVMAQNTTEQQPVDNPNAPVITFESETYDYGRVPLNSDGSCEFKFRNTGKEPLILTNVRASCGCTVPSWPQEPIAPGESGVISVRYTTMNRVHTINKNITVQSNASNPTIMLRLTGEVFDPAVTTAPDPAPQN